MVKVHKKLFIIQAAGDKKQNKPNKQAVGLVHDISGEGLITVVWTDGTTSSVPPTSLLSESVIFGDAFDWFQIVKFQIHKKS